MRFDHRTSTGLGKQTLRRHKQNLCTPGARRKKLIQTCLWVSRSLGWRSGSTAACGTVRALNTIVPAQVLLKEVAITLITPTIVGLRPNNREGTQPRPSNEKWIQDLLSMAPPIRTRPSFPPSQSLPSGRFHKPLILIHQSKNHNHRKPTKLITWITALSNSMKLWAMPCGATQDGQVMVESSDKTGSTGEGNSKLQYSCLENPMNSMKRQKMITWRLNNLLLRNQWVNNEIKEEI